MSSSSIVQTASAKLLNSNSIATAASIGVHGLVLLVLLPSLSGFSQAEKAVPPRNVGVIELTPAERTRLPDLSQSSQTIPPSLPNTPPSDTTIVNPAPLPTDIPSSLSSIPPTPPLPPLSYNNNLPLTPINPPVWLNPPRPLTPPPPPNQLPPAPEINPQNEAPRPDFGPPKQAIDPNALINQKNPNLLPGNLTPQALDQTPQETATNSRTIFNPSATQPSPMPQEETNLREDTTNTTRDEALRNYVAWLPKAGEPKPETISISGTYPKAACSLQSKEAISAEYGVLVNPQGQVAEIQEFQGTGYANFNEQARRDIASRSFPNTTGQPKPYRVTVNFNYDSKVCPPLNVPSSEPTRNNTTQPPETAKPAPESSILAPTPSKVPGTTESPTVPRSTPQTSIIAPAAPKKEPETPAAATPTPAPEIETAPEAPDAPTENQVNEQP